MIRSKPDFYRVLANPARYTLYVFCTDLPRRCGGIRTSTHPPLIVQGQLVAAAGSGVKPKRLGIRRLSNGGRQATYYGYPLYLYSGDHKPGWAKGQFSRRKHPRGTWCIITTGGVPCPPTY